MGSLARSFAAVVWALKPLAAPTRVSVFVNLSAPDAVADNATPVASSAGIGRKVAPIGVADNHKTHGSDPPGFT